MKRSKFSLSHYRLLTADMGRIYPIACIDVLPGDSMQQATTALIRMSPMLAPVMHPINMRIHHWFVPYRLIWDDFEDFITGNAEPDFPVLNLVAGAGNRQCIKGSIFDYFGLMPLKDSQKMEVSALPLRAYSLIYNHFYRDQDLADELEISTASGVDTTTGMSDAKPVKHSWEKDYFTTARPWTQKGNSVSIPITGAGAFTGSLKPDGNMVFSGGGADFPLNGIKLSATSDMPITDNGTAVRPFNGLNPFISHASGFASSGGGAFIKSSGGTPTPLQYKSGMKVDGSVNFNADSISINDLRLALSLQRYQEARANYGSRYVEYLRYLGVRSSDARLQLPEYLGGGRQLLQISEVLQTAEGESGVGTMRGHGLGTIRSNRYRRFFEEHGVVISLLMIDPKPMYVDGTQRMWLKRTKEDFFQKELQHLGMQEVFKQELYGAANKGDVFGYQDRYDEYRRAWSGVSGDFRDTLNFWHLGRTFDSAPTLNADFIYKEPSKRIFAEQTQNAFWIMANHSIQARRMLTKRARPMTY